MRPLAARQVKSFAKRLYAEIERDQVANGAAALAFYTMLAVFPAAIFGLSLLAYLPIPHLEQAIFELLSELLPNATADMFRSTVQHILSERNGRLLSFGLLFAIWTASSGLYAIMQQLNVVYRIEEGRPYWKARAVALLLMCIFFVLLATTFGLVIFGGVLQDWIGDRLGWSATLRLCFVLFRWLVIATALLAAFALVYRIAPDTKRPFRLFRVGNLVAVAGFLLASFGFRVYVANLASFGATYGGLGAAIVLLLWLFIVGWVILIGGEVNHLLDISRREPALEANARQLSLPDISQNPTRQRAPHAQVSIVVWGALAANLAISAAKYFAAGVTGSSALLSEAIHSTADTCNELLLVVGSKLSQKPADRVHPFDRGQEIYFWGLIVALVLFALGGGLSVYEGILHVMEPRKIEEVGWNYFVLGCALVFESSSFTLAARTMHKSAKRFRKTLIDAAHDSKNPEHFVVLFEDAAAILGILVAAAGVFASHTLGIPLADGAASIVIGLILTAAALVLAYECRNLLLGESADPEKLAAIRALVAGDHAVERVGQALTMYLGPDEILLNMQVDFKDTLSAREIEAAVQRLETAIRHQHPDVQHIFIEAASLAAQLPPAAIF
jgi:cation diffusion facilitator family transporter